MVCHVTVISITTSGSTCLSQYSQQLQLQGTRMYRKNMKDKSEANIRQRPQTHALNHNACRTTAEGAASELRTTKRCCSSTCQSTVSVPLPTFAANCTLLCTDQALSASPALSRKYAEHNYFSFHTRMRCPTLGHSNLPVCTVVCCRPERLHHYHTDTPYTPQNTGADLRCKCTGSDKS